MRFFDMYSSNTTAGSGNHHFFGTQGSARIGRIFYKITNGGKYRYSLLFSNIMDSTYADGSVSHCNLICKSWELLGIRVGVFGADFFTDVPETLSAERMEREMQTVTIDGNVSKTVMPGAFFTTDPVELNFQKGEYLCVEMTYCGDMIPNHFESIIPAYRFEEGEWVLSKDMPYPGMIGCDRAAKVRIGYLGDSITQGIGTDVNSYEHWNAQLSEKLGDACSFWNLGIGYGRGADAATDGAWLYKAKHNDLVVVCLGVNDINQGLTADTIKKAMAEILTRLQGAGIRVLLQTVPPFDYDSARKATWLEVNRYIREELRGKAEGFFDVVPVLGKGGEQSEVAIYGGHPDAVGCKVWAQALYPEVKRVLDLYF